MVAVPTEVVLNAVLLPILDHILRATELAQDGDGLDVSDIG
jgi:hypothetical protein